MTKMTVEVIAFGIAKDIIHDKSTKLELSADSRVSDLKSLLLSRYPALESLVSLKVAVNANYVEDAYLLKENDEVVLIPPVSGG